MGPFVKAWSGNRCSVLLTTDGRVCRFGESGGSVDCFLFSASGLLFVCLGKSFNGQSIPAEFLEFPNQAKIVDLSLAASYTLALAENGDVYYWGKYQVITE